MPFGLKPKCFQCEKTDSFMWRKTEDGFICNECVEQQRNSKLKGNRDQTSISKSVVDNNDPRCARKSARTTRNYKTRLNPFALPKPYTPKGKGRRIIFKKTPQKAPGAVTSPVTSNFVFHKGSYIQVGDIVSLQDVDGDIFYAQIRGLLTDQYCEKSAVITWLIPTIASPEPEDGFDPATYVIGPDEDIPRKLECMEFVMHAPSDYYKANTPYPPTNPPESRKSFIWTKLSVKIPKQD
ncbi:hypothetical protein ONE63_008725 [Megalurothrips usitatus]|uniref:GATA zinc finger domain-containing protein 1 n=1 Tax=Megalurothrips usitatus TaxID=439358 RepID=A0AAV7XPI5_9NEOP|nr:hypothetical protein ONE63_008725 [Megalurothrips usitatus]